MVFSLVVLSWLLGPCWCGTPFFFLSASCSSLQVRRQRRWKRQSHICILYPLFYIFRVCAHLRSGEGQTFDWYFKGIVQNMGKKSLINLSQFKILASSSEKPVLQSRPHKLWLRGRTPHTRRLPQQFPDRVEVDLLLLLLFQNQTQDQFFVFLDFMIEYLCWPG